MELMRADPGPNTAGQPPSSSLAPSRAPSSLRLPTASHVLFEPIFFRCYSRLKPLTRRVFQLEADVDTLNNANNSLRIDNRLTEGDCTIRYRSQVRRVNTLENNVYVLFDSQYSLFRLLRKLSVAVKPYTEEIDPTHRHSATRDLLRVIDGMSRAAHPAVNGPPRPVSPSNPMEIANMDALDFLPLQ